MTKSFFILKRKNKTYVIHFEDIYLLEYVPQHKEPRIEYYSNTNQITFPRLDYDVDKDPNARIVLDSWTLYFKKRLGETNQPIAFKLEKKEYNKIKKWLKELDKDE